jgi:hypothetical protein
MAKEGRIPIFVILSRVLGNLGRHDGEIRMKIFEQEGWMARKYLIP